MVIRIYGILIIYYKIWVIAYVSVVVESDFICALVYRNLVVGKNKYSLPRIDDLFDQAFRGLMFFLRLILDQDIIS